MRKLSFAALLARWIDFARSSLALPHDDTGRRLRDSVADLIMLQAVTWALGELGELDAAERALGLDRAELLIEKHAAALEERWVSQGLPPQLRELVDDARAALHKAGGTR